VCTGLLALFLALNKRRGELADGADGSSRRVLHRYDVRLLDRLVLGVGAAILGAAALGRDSLLLLLAFLALQLLYSTWLKHVVLVDVLAIAALFVIRAAAGAVAIDVTVSGWLLVCTGLLALFLALNKRRGELADGGDGASRRGLHRYDVRLLDRLVLGVGAATLAVYAAYCVTGTRPPLFPLTIVPVAFGLARYVFLVRRRAAGQEPEKVLVGDPPILVATLVWAVLAAVLLAAG